MRTLTHTCGAASVDEFTGKHARQPEHNHVPDTQVQQICVSLLFAAESPPLLYSLRCKITCESSCLQGGTSVIGGDKQPSTSDPASFFLELGLSSLVGRNFSAGLARLEQCKQLLLGSSAADYAKLGAVCGSQVCAIIILQSLLCT